MLIQVRELLDKQTVAYCRKLLENSEWKDGRHTAGTQSEKVKNNEQLPETALELAELRAIIIKNIQKNGLFFSASLPKKIYPPLFNRYSGETNSFGNHVDNSVRTFAKTGENVRTDISCTVFLSETHEYEGGELMIEDAYGSKSVKLAAGDAILYPSTSLHRVEPVTKGARIASFFWIESMIRSNDVRRILFDMDMAILSLRQQFGDTEQAVVLTSCYHNLTRLFADT
jgi:PKHD-type hydroxylase